MAYIDDVNGRRTTALAGVVGVHALLGWALVSGLASQVVQRLVPDSIVARNIEMPTPPVAPPDSPRVRLDEVRAEVVAPRVDVLAPTEGERDALTPTTVEARPEGMSQGPVVVERPADPPLPPVAVSRAAVAGPSVGLGSDDYPDASRRAGEEGAMSVRVDIGADGRVTGCAVTRSSGYPRLDARACQVAMRRWRFTPASEDGRPVASSAERSVTWRLVR